MLGRFWECRDCVMEEELVGNRIGRLRLGGRRFAKAGGGSYIAEEGK